MDQTTCLRCGKDLLGFQYCGKILEGELEHSSNICCCLQSQVITEHLPTLTLVRGGTDETDLMEHCKPFFYRSESFYQESCFLSFCLQPLYSKRMIHELFVPYNPTQDFICISNLVPMCVYVCMIVHVYVFLCL